MSDFTNDMRYPKRGSVQFDTKDRIDILISKTGGDRSMNIVYSDPETGEILQTSEGGGGGGVQNYDLFVINGTTITSDECFIQNSQPASTGREAIASLTGCYAISLTAGSTYNATLSYNGDTLTGSGTATENSFTHNVNLNISLAEGSLSIGFTGSSMGTQIAFDGFGTNGEYATVQAATVEAAVQALATNIASLGLVITSVS